MLVKVELNTEEICYHEPNPDDQWDSGSYGLMIHGVSVRKSDREYDSEFLGSVGDACVVLVEHYRDGDTFGDSEYAEIKGVFATMAEAEIVAKGINVDHGYFGHFIDFKYLEAIVKP